jgi:hypothetical protein
MSHPLIPKLLYKLLFYNHLGFGCQLLVVRRTTNNYLIINAKSDVMSFLKAI